MSSDYEGVPFTSDGGWSTYEPAHYRRPVLQEFECAYCGRPRNRFSEHPCDSCGASRRALVQRASALTTDRFWYGQRLR